jgi:hypothetical protein
MTLPEVFSAALKSFQCMLEQHALRIKIQQSALNGTMDDLEGVGEQGLVEKLFPIHFLRRVCCYLPSQVMIMKLQLS